MISTVASLLLAWALGYVLGYKVKQIKSTMAAI